MIYNGYDLSVQKLAQASAGNVVENDSILSTGRSGFNTNKNAVHDYNYEFESKPKSILK